MKVKIKLTFKKIINENQVGDKVLYQNFNPSSGSTDGANKLMTMALCT